MEISLSPARWPIIFSASDSLCRNLDGLVVLFPCARRFNAARFIVVLQLLRDATVLEYV